MVVSASTAGKKGKAPATTQVLTVMGFDSWLLVAAAPTYVTHRLWIILCLALVGSSGMAVILNALPGLLTKVSESLRSSLSMSAFTVCYFLVAIVVFLRLSRPTAVLCRYGTGNMNHCRIGSLCRKIGKIM